MLAKYGAELGLAMAGPARHNSIRERLGRLAHGPYAPPAGAGRPTSNLMRVCREEYCLGWLSAPTFQTICAAAQELEKQSDFWFRIAF